MGTFSSQLEPAVLDQNQARQTQTQGVGLLLLPSPSRQRTPFPPPTVLTTMTPQAGLPSGGGQKKMTLYLKAKDQIFPWDSYLPPLREP